MSEGPDALSQIAHVRSTEVTRRRDGAVPPPGRAEDEIVHTVDGNSPNPDDVANAAHR